MDLQISYPLLIQITPVLVFIGFKKAGLNPVFCRFSLLYDFVGLIVNLKEISSLSKTDMKYNKVKTWNVLLLVLRIWLGYRMIAAGYSSVIGILSSQHERDFFEKWFGTELHFPMPVLMAFLAKGSEVAGGFFVLIGLFTKPAAALIAFTMIVATLTANLGENWVIDGGFTISYTLFSLILIVEGAGKYSVDYLLFRRKNVDSQNSKGLHTAKVSSSSH